MRFSPDGTKLAVGNHDQFIYIYDAASGSLISKCQKHSSYITAVDWSLDSTAVKSTCGAYELLYFAMESDTLNQVPEGRSAYKNEEWATYSTHFGWPVQGIFGGLIDYTHVNRVDRSPDKQFFAVGNDWGLVEIFGNPNSESAKSKAFRGHSEHVTNVKWPADGGRLFSAGGYDQCIMQWKKG
jgi:WD40 repeat protein